MSADPLAVHAPGEADLNLYAYVSGHVLQSIDPMGLQETAAQSDAAQMNASYLGSAGSSHTSNAWRAGQGTGASSGSSSQPAPSGSGDDAASGSSEGDGQGTDSAGAPDPIGEAPLTPAGPAAAASNTGATASTPPKEHLGFFGRLSRDVTVAMAILGGDSDSIREADEKTSERGMPGGRGDAAETTGLGQALYGAAIALGGKAKQGAKAAYRSTKKGIAAGIEGAKKELRAFMKVGTVPKTPHGPGAVPKSQRDPKRLFTPKERSDKRASQGHRCPGCETEIDASNSRGHHLKRHADGGKTIPENHVEICIDCHRKVHEP